jgi:hypothetical protein
MFWGEGMGGALQPGVDVAGGFFAVARGDCHIGVLSPTPRKLSAYESAGIRRY